MYRNPIYYLTLIVLLAACAPAAAVFSVEVSGPELSATVIQTPESLYAADIPQLTMTVAPSCQTSQNISLKIMPLGDSITHGDGVLDYGGYRNLLGALLTSDGYQFDFVGSQQTAEDVLPDANNEGHPGWRISNIKNGIDSEGWLETYQPDIILLHIGSNDLRYGNSAYAPDNLSDLLDDILVRLPEVHIIVAQIIRTRWGSDAKHHFFNDAIPDVVASKGMRVSVVDMRDVLSNNDFTTLYHPSPIGYDKMAHAWETAILALDLGKCIAP